MPLRCKDMPFWKGHLIGLDIRLLSEQAGKRVQQKGVQYDKVILLQLHDAL